MHCLHQHVFPIAYFILLNVVIYQLFDLGGQLAALDSMSLSGNLPYAMSIAFYIWCFVYVANKLSTYLFGGVILNL